VDWVVAVAWSSVLLAALLVFGLCGYQIRWRLHRLRRDLASLHQLRADLYVVRTQLESARRRAAAVRTGG
jgi:hypothetical protein